MTKIDTIATNILRDLALDFIDRALPASDLNRDYAGLGIPLLRDRYAEGNVVDFDLAVSELEGAGQIRSGPMVAYDNHRNSAVIVVGSYSKRQYLRLTDKGYREAQRRATVSKQAPSGGHHVAITNSTIFQSAIGAGDQFNQTIDIASDSEVIERLTELARVSRMVADHDIPHEVTILVAAARSTNLEGVKPVFQRLYGAAANGIGQVAWGVVSAIVAASLGIG